MSGRVILKPGREKPVRQRHPWIFGGAIQRVEQKVQDGDVADVVAHDGAFLARGYVNQRSQIVVRILTWNAEEAIDEGFWRARLERAILARDGAESACRLVNAEADGLPGLVVDRYGDWLVLQSLTLGIEKHKAQIVAALAGLLKVRGIYERSDVDVRQKEGLAETTGLLWGEEPPEWLEITDRAVNDQEIRMQVDLRHGQKTGHYLDQRLNRRAAAAWCAGREVLNLFAYTGGFALQALAAGAKRVINVDSSAEALAQARRNMELNGVAVSDEDFVVGNVFEVLRRYRAEERRFDAIILDPPKLASSSAQVDRAARAYKDLNLIAMQLLNPGGLLATFSCSGRISADLFQKIVFGASIDAGREGQIIEKLSHPADHPILLTFPEGDYLKGLICRVW